MEHLRNWLLPILLGIGWIALMPSLAASMGAPMSTEEFVAGAAASAVAAIALGFRRRAPLTTLGVVTAVLIVGHLSTSSEGLAIPPVEMVALYSVAVRCAPVVGWRAVGVMAVVQALTALIGYGPGVDFVGEAVINSVLYVVILGAGQNRRRRLGAREDTARQLREADDRRQDAAAAERRRLARELHDVSAHHLTSIVVTGTAAERLAGSRPELAAEALTYAANTGRETLRSLHQLVAMLETGERDQSEPLGARITGLAEAFTRLGQQVVADVTPELSGPVGEAVFGIVRESLTNTLRHAPGAAVRVLVTRAGEQVDVLVENGQPTGTATTGQGGQRGVAGMKDRAEALGGTLTARPGPDGGWQVRASLPSPTALAAVPPLRSSVRWRDRWLSEAGVLLSVTTTAVGGTALAASEERQLDTATVSIALLLALIPGLILLGRRDRPWIVLAGIAVSASLWPLAVGLDWLPDALSPTLAFAFPAHLAAVYAVAAYGGHPSVTWPSFIASGVGIGTATGVLVAVAPAADDPTDAAFPVVIGAMVAFLATLPLVGAWIAGVMVRQKRIQRLDHTGATLAALVWATETEVHTERQRIAAGLHHSVLTRTHQMIALAESADLPGVTAEARSALTAMRELLATLDEDGTPAPRSPSLKELP
ncbi:histidine kinase [Kribbella antibiotica]|nr:histidine kinase [Kribbella antibiotica]